MREHMNVILRPTAKNLVFRAFRNKILRLRTRMTL